MNVLKKLPPEWRAQLLEEERQATEAAEVFARVCCEDRADLLADAALRLYECVDAWRPAMALVAKLPRVSPELQQAFIPIWVESKHLPLAVGNRRILADALRVLMPCSYSGSPLVLYRGTTANERRRRLYGFSWTTDVGVARNFAASRAHVIPMLGEPPLRTHGAVLRTLAPSDAIMLIRQPEDYYDEGEVVVNPFRFGKVELVERHEAEEAK
jgi:hypothetical protein